MSATAIGGATDERGRERKDRVRVVIAEDSVLLREGLARLLEEYGFEVAGQAGDAEDLLRKVGAHKPAVAIIDVRMPPTHTDEGLRAARRIRAEHPGTAVLVLSQYVEEAYALELLSETTESTGYLLKDRIADVETFTDAVRRVAGGGSALDPEVVGLLLGRRRREDPLAVLSPREREVLGLMAEGRSNSAMGMSLVGVRLVPPRRGQAAHGDASLLPICSLPRVAVLPLSPPPQGSDTKDFSSHDPAPDLLSLPRVHPSRRSRAALAPQCRARFRADLVTALTPTTLA